MFLLDKLFRKPKIVEERLPQDEGIAYPIGYRREGDDLIIVESEYTEKWVNQFPDKIVAVTKMLAFLKSQYPEVTRFEIRK